MVLFGMGICMPMFSLQKFFVVNDTFSLLGGVQELITLKEFFLAAIIVAFSILTPLLKFAFSWLVLGTENSDPTKHLFAVRALSKICKWSMADVFIISILAATIKLGGLATVNVHVGLFFFAGYVLLSMILTYRLLSGYALQPKQAG